MPDFSKCVKDKNGDIWCVDKKSRCIYKVILEQPVITTIPQELLFDLLMADNDENN